MSWRFGGAQESSIRAAVLQTIPPYKMNLCVTADLFIYSQWCRGVAEHRTLISQILTDAVLMKLSLPCHK